MGKVKVTRKVATAKERKAIETPKRGKDGVAMFGNAAKGHTLVTAPQVAAALGIDAKRFRAWIRGNGNDGLYTRYGFDLDSAKGKALIAAAMAHFGVTTLHWPS